jgi:hypothetical protein
MKFAKFISIVAHPLFMPIYGILLLFQFHPALDIVVPEPVKSIVYSIIVLFTLILPLITTLVMKKLKVINSYYMDTTEERKWPLLFTVLWYFLATEILLKLQLPPSIYLLMIGAITVVVCGLLITMRWKISIHMLGIGGLTGAIIAVSQRFDLNLVLLVSVLFVVAGAIGYARLKTNSHNSNQVYVGFALGILIEWLTVYFF